jgi:hypothetical protein
MMCAICRSRRARRFCPGVRGDICSICCGTEREITVDCPLDCEYLQEARKRDKAATLDPEQVPNRDIKISERFVEEHHQLLSFLVQTLTEVASATGGVVDFDLREALGALVRTYRTLESGVYYESIPPNPVAAAIFRRVQRDLPEFRRLEQQQEGLTRTRDADVLGCLAFLERLEWTHNNGRRRGRAFVSALSDIYGGRRPSPSSSATSLLLP